MEEISFTEFLLPHGRRRPITFKRTPELAAKARELVAAGYSFEYETLRNGVVHMDCCDDDGQLASTLVFQGQNELEAVDQLIENAYDRWKKMSRRKNPANP